jgi:hypothetical protein
MTRRGHRVSAESIVISDGHDTHEFPRVGEPWRQVLEPLTNRQLAACVRQGRQDRRRDVCGKPPRIDFYLSWHLVDAVETLAEWPIEQDELLMRHEVLMSVVSKEVSEYWSHVTKENRLHHPRSEEDYLRGLVQRIQDERPT